MDRDIEMLASENGGYWGEHPVHSSEDWRADVANGDSRRGYWEWVEARLQDQADEGDERAKQELKDARAAARA